ncbi:MAG: response regulator [Deltaproteobacteria bacterium]|nr:response regulator [Deltaproteobacteria bacterium]
MPRKKVVVIQMEASFAQSLRAQFESQGIAAVVATGSSPALVDCVRREKPHLIVLSAALPAGSREGFFVLGHLKKNRELSRIPVIVTGETEALEAHKKLKTHAEDYQVGYVDA